MADSKSGKLDVKKEAPEGAPIGADQPVGKMIASTRESRGLSRKDVTRDTQIPEYYVRTIESDDYSLIADQIYLLPFLRRYAQFLGLDAEKIATRFVRDVQKADVFAARMSKPIPVVEKKPWSRRRRSMLIVALVVVALGVAGFFIRRSRLQSFGKHASVQSSHILRLPLPQPTPAPAASAVAAPAPPAAKASAIASKVTPERGPLAAPRQESPAHATR